MLFQGGEILVGWEKKSHAEAQVSNIDNLQSILVQGRFEIK